MELEINDTVLVSYLNGSAKRRVNLQGQVTGIYQNYYVIQTKNYRITIQRPIQDRVLKIAKYTK